MTTVGFLGLGAMGSGIARRLVDGGHSVVVWNRSRPAVDALVAYGATGADRAADALAADVSFSMLADDEAAEGVLGAAVTSAAGGIHVNMASISVAAAARLTAEFAAHGARYVASPVIGRPPVAAAGRLNLMVAGPGDAVAAVMPYLEQLSSRVWRFGETPATANAVKIAVNYNLIHVIQALGESIAIVERQGVDPSLFVELLTSSIFGGVAYSGYGNEIATRGYTPPGFTMALAYKDLGLVRELADAGGVRPATMPALFDVFERALADPELCAFDWGAIAEVTRRDLL
jgi:3-hydroxyisobutyrate dehydrogenase-like beta-hydroxyacid dehydrogenase